MFDSAPSNLPVEPGSATPAPVVPPAPMPEPSVMPSMPSPAPAKPMSTGSLKKEPEDIFSGLDTGNDAPADMGGMEMEPERHSSPVKFIAVALIIILVVAGLGAAAWYFLIREQPSESGIVTPTTTTPTVVTSDSEPIIETPPVLPPEPGTEATPNLPPPDSITTSTTPTVPTAPPAIQLTEALDTDGDGLSDPEETAVGADMTMPDSDGDGFTDGSELQNGYDPAATKLTVSGSSRFHEIMLGAGSVNLGVFVPAAWTVGPLIASTGETPILTGTPTEFTVMSSQRPAGSDFADWLASNDPTVDPSSLRQFTTRAGYTAHMSLDRLHTYLEIRDYVFVITYKTSGSSYDYRALYDFIIQTIRIR